MHEVKEFLNTYNIKPTSYKKNNTSYIVSDQKNTYIIEKEKIDRRILNILKARNYDFIPEVLNDEKAKYQISKYYASYDLPDEEKAKDIIILTALLHAKTTHYEGADTTYYKEIYEDLALKIDDFYNYITELNELLFEDIYMAPSMYLLARNISKVYSLIEFLTNELDNWYTIANKKDKKRVSVIHNNLSTNNYLKNNKGYLTSWYKSKIDLPIKDIEIFYRNSYDKIDFESILDIYLEKYPLYDYELKLLFITMSLPNKMNFTSDEYQNVLEVENFYDYIYKTDRLLSKYYAQNKEKEN